MSEVRRSERSPSTERPHVVAVSGSQRADSYTRQALRIAMSGVEGAGGTAELLDLAQLNLSGFDPDVDDATEGKGVRRPIREADAVIFGTPTYHGSYSGVLKNAIDYCDYDEFENTTVGLLAVSGGPFPTTALEHLRAVCRSLHAWVLPYQAAVPRANTGFDSGTLLDEELYERIQQLGTSVVAYAGIEPAPIRSARAQGV